MESIAQMYWEVTCNFCIKVRNVLGKIFNKMIEAGERAGRARAAAELARQGYYDAAKEIMLRK